METKFTLKDKTLDWLQEIDQCVTFKERKHIRLTPLLKEILIRNVGAYKKDEIEILKYQLIKFVVSDSENLGLTRTSGLFMSKDDCKFFPLYNGCHRSHLFLREVVWDNFRSKELAIKKN